MQHSYLYNPSPLFRTTTMPFCTSKTWNFLVAHNFFMEELSYVLTKNFVACVHFVRFYFLHCHSFPPCWPQVFLIFSPPLWNLHVFPNEIRPPCFSSLALALSLSSTWVVDIKNNLEKDSTLLLCFLSKCPGGHAISRQKHLDLPVVAYLLIDHFTVIPAFEWMWG